ncbi:MAG: hypothetical protein KJO98_02765, partial [Rhodothermia bacterium]|nr:hypothetical protein [Rhodothermia bacterium]
DDQVRHTRESEYPQAFAALLILAIALLPSAAYGQDAGAPAAADLESRVSELFEQTCARAGCHAGPVAQMDLFLTSSQFYASTVDVPSTERPDLKRVDPGNPEESYLMMKVNGSPDIVGLPMPMTGEKLSEDEIQLIEDWIRSLQGAEARPVQETPEIFPFDGWKAINLPTTRMVDQGSWLFLISHRFNPTIGDGYEAFYGLDGSGIIFLSMGYAFSDEFLVSLARSNSADNVELWSRYRLGRQGRDGWPVSLALQGAVNWVTEEPTVQDRYSGDAFKFSLQAAASRELTDGLGVAIVPGIITNPVESVDGENALVTLGLAGQWNFHRNLSLVAEWVPIVTGYSRSTTFGNDIRFDSWGSAFQITTGGHVFQIVLSNSVGLTADQYMRGGDLDIQDVDVRLGFNIFRVINF